MNSSSRPCDYRLTVSRAWGFSHRKPVKSRHPITNAGCRKMTRSAENSSREAPGENALDDAENNFSKVARPSALFNFFPADSATFPLSFPSSTRRFTFRGLFSLFFAIGQQPNTKSGIIAYAHASRWKRNADWGFWEFVSVYLPEHTNPKTENDPSQR